MELGDIRIPVLCTAALGAGPFMFARGFRFMRISRLIENTPTAHIRSMAMGLVEINGAVEPRSIVTAPFSGRACAYWEVDIAVRGRRRNGWTVVHRNQSGHPFYLRDETGVALVLPMGAECKIFYGTEEESMGLSLPECYAYYLRDHSTALGPMARLGVMRFRERMLEEGQRVYVLGTASPRARAVSLTDDTVLAATGTDDRIAKRLRTLDDETVALVRRGENERTFIISQESERQIVQTLHWKSAGMILLGPTLTLIGLCYWLYVLSMGRWP